MLDEYYDDAADERDAEGIEVDAGEDLTGFDAELAPGAVISGTVTATIGGLPLDDICVDAEGPDFGNDATDETGEYSITGLEAGSYTLHFEACGSGGGSYAPEYFHDKLTRVTATRVVVAAAGTATANEDLGPAGSISGRVTGPGAVGLGSSCVRAETQGGNQIAEVQTDFEGAYEISGLATGSYIVSFNDCQDRGLVDEYYENAPLRSDAEPVAVLAGAETSAIDAELAAGAAIEGTVIDPDGFPADGACIDVYDADGRRTAGTDVNSNGTYSVDSLAAGTYTVHFEDCNGTSLAGEWWEDEPLRTDATPITVAAGATADGIDAQLERGGQISGDVVDAAGDPIADGCVTVFEATSGAEAEDAGVGNDGHYSVRGLRAGQYKVLFACGNFAAEFYEDESTFAAADPVSLTAGGSEIVNATRGSGGTISGDRHGILGLACGRRLRDRHRPGGRGDGGRLRGDGRGRRLHDGRRRNGFVQGVFRRKLLRRRATRRVLRRLADVRRCGSRRGDGGQRHARHRRGSRQRCPVPADDDRQRPVRHDHRDFGDLRLQLQRGRFDVRVPARRRRVRPLHLAARAERARRRRPHVPGPGDGCRREHGCDSRHPQLHRRRRRSPRLPTTPPAREAQAAAEKAAAKVAKAKKKVKKAEGKEKKTKARKKLKRAKGKLA